jgi:hypothetical protein
MEAAVIQMDEVLLRRFVSSLFHYTNLSFGRIFEYSVINALFLAGGAVSDEVRG